MGTLFLAIVFISALLGFATGAAVRADDVQMRAALNMIAGIALATYVLNFIFDKIFPAVTEQTNDTPGKRDLKIIVINGDGEPVSELSSHDYIDAGRKAHWYKKLPRIMKHGNVKNT